MVALPKYVRAVPKSNGRTYHYFEKFRRTARAWPRVPIAGDPLSEEFARRAAQCDRLEWAADSGFAFRDCGGRRHVLPLPSAGVGDEFWKAADRAEEIGRRLAAGERKTFCALIVDFKNSDAYLTGIGESTRESYDRDIKTIEATWGDDPVRALTPEDAQKAIDSYQGRPAAGRAFRATLSRLIGWGIPRGYAVANPVKETEKYISDGTYDPWPPWAFELFFDKARLGMHLPAYSSLFTGQRSVDVYRMMKPAPKATEMPLVAQKTKDLIPVQIHSEYRAIINAAFPVVEGNIVALRDEAPQPLHLREDGGAWTLAGAKTAWQREMDRGVFKPFREHRLVFHGLRKNAVCYLLEVGCTEAMVEAIVGMSPAMVAHYAKQVHKFRLARSAMVQLEAGWASIRTSILGGVRQVK